MRWVLSYALGLIAGLGVLACVLGVVAVSHGEWVGVLPILAAPAIVGLTVATLVMVWEDAEF